MPGNEGEEYRMRIPKHIMKVFFVNTTKTTVRFDAFYTQDWQDCRRQLKLITSVKVGHSRTSVYSIKRFGEYPYSTEYSNDDIHTVISIKYLQLPQVF